MPVVLRVFYTACSIDCFVLVAVLGWKGEYKFVVGYLQHINYWKVCWKCWYFTLMTSACKPSPGTSLFSLSWEKNQIPTKNMCESHPSMLHWCLAHLLKCVITLFSLLLVLTFVKGMMQAMLICCEIPFLHLIIQNRYGRSSFTLLYKPVHQINSDTMINLMKSHDIMQKQESVLNWHIKSLLHLKANT